VAEQPCGIKARPFTSTIFLAGIRIGHENRLLYRCFTAYLRSFAGVSYRRTSHAHDKKKSPRPDSSSASPI